MAFLVAASDAEELAQCGREKIIGYPDVILRN
jgi:hypothetical protein